MLDIEKPTIEKLGSGPDVLPIINYGESIIDSVTGSPVTIITAETGAGKSTQVPQMLAEAGYEVIVTQPRIVAARTVAQRVADEMGEKLGGRVGYVTAKEKAVSRDSDILFCTDGLQVVKSLSNNVGRVKSKPQVLVLDEVHEWNANMEVLVAWAKQRAQEDPENFKVVLMSATLEAEKLSEYFATAHASDVISVPGRTFNVEKDFVETDQDLRSIIRAVSEEAQSKAQEGKNTLVFLPGVGEIEEAMSYLSDLNEQFEVIPMHGKLTKDEQAKAFKKSVKPKIILATNVAQTSLTIPDIDAVVDSGLERRIEVKDGVEGLKLGLISRADCLQRAGRAGRTKEGQYVLVSSHSLDDRPEFPTPEIRRSRLDKTVLRLARHGFDAAELDFFHQPDTTEIKLAQTTLHNMGALDTAGAITEIGREMDRYPVEAHYARMLVEAKKHGIQDVMCQVIGLMDTGDIRYRSGHEKANIYMARKTSDIIAQLQLYANALMAPNNVNEMGVGKKKFNIAQAKIRQLSSALGIDAIDPFTVLDLLRDDSIINKISKSIVAGMIDRLFKNYSGDWYVDNKGKQRLIGNQSIVSERSAWVVGDPFDISTRGGDTLPLITNVTPVRAEWLMEIAPHLVKLEPTSGWIYPHFNQAGNPYRDGALIFNGHRVGEHEVPIDTSALKEDERRAIIDRLMNFIPDSPSVAHYKREAQLLGSDPEIQTFYPYLEGDILSNIRQLLVSKVKDSGSLNLNHLLANPPELEPWEVFSDELIDELSSISARFPKILPLEGVFTQINYSRDYYGLEAAVRMNVTDFESNRELLSEFLIEGASLNIIIVDDNGEELFSKHSFDSIGRHLDYLKAREEERLERERLEAARIEAEELDRLERARLQLEAATNCTEIEQALDDLGLGITDLDTITECALPEGVEVWPPDWIQDECDEHGTLDNIKVSRGRDYKGRGNESEVVIARNLENGNGYIEVLTDTSISGATRYFYVRYVPEIMPEGYPVLDDDPLNSLAVDATQTSEKDNQLDFSGLENLGIIRS
jgi:late competence protein required for DNA uptake (superfamily II DNA/RNA helicase)